MKRCSDMVALMSEELDGCLDSEAHAALMAHLAACPTCRRVYDELVSALSLLRAVPPQPAPPDMVARVRRRLERPHAVLDMASILNRAPVRTALAASFLLLVSFYALRRPEVVRDVDEIPMESDVPDVRRQVAAPDSPRPAPGSPRPARDDVTGRIWQAPSEAAAPLGLSVGGAAGDRDERVRRDLPQAMPRASVARRLRPDGAADSAAFDRLESGAREFLAEDADVAAVAPETGVDAAARLVVANRAFAVELYRELAAMQDGNILFSPYSMHAALGMAYAGAAGETAREMGAMLRWPHARTELPPAFRALDRQVAAAARAGGQMLHVANGLCLTGGDVGADYRTLLRDSFSAEIFTGGLAEINAWAARKTDGLINRMLDHLAPDSVCVLMNAISFKGIWRDPFDPALTREAWFHPAPNRQASVMMMHRTGHYRLLETADYQAIALPYQGDRLSMIVVLPWELDGMAALESRLSAQTLAGWGAGLGRQPERRVQVHLPRFTLETAYDLVEPCRNLGMREAFMADVADFTNMGWPQGDLWISQVRHTAVMAVDEEGTEAAAVTAVEMQTRSVQPPDPVFQADRPFLFLIHDNRTGCILFMGRLRDMQPNQSSGQ